MVVETLPCLSYTQTYKMTERRLKSYRGWKVAIGLGLGGSNIGEILNHFLGVLCLAGSGLSRAQNTLVLAILNKQIKIAPKMLRI